jgi:hypothetical protein
LLPGCHQAVLGGQPLLIVGVAEPIVVIWAFLWQFAVSNPALGPQLFHPWTAWVCCWTAVLVLLLALGGACRAIAAFTRFSGEVFGALIAVLFLQVAIKVSPAGPCMGFENSAHALLAAQQFNLVHPLAMTLLHMICSLWRLASVTASSCCIPAVAMRMCVPGCNACRAW